MSGHHHLLVCSEEQMKMFTLPALKSKYKEKLTAVHGVKVRKVAPIKIRKDDQSLNFLGCMLNDGNVCVFSLPALYRQITDKLVEADNKIATLYTEFTNEGSAYVLEQTNLIKHYTLNKSTKPKPIGVALPEGCRPVNITEPEPEPVPEPEPEAEEGAGEVEETVEAENAENVESAPPPVTDEGTEEKPAEEETTSPEEEGPAEDLPSVEEEAKKMIDDAEESKDVEFQERIQNELSSDNPEITTTTVTTYRAIESKTIISTDDGVQCSKIITTTRDTTLSLDGDVVTQKTQQKEEFEISPSEEQEPGEVGQGGFETAGDTEEAPSEDVVEVQTTTYVESAPPVETTTEVTEEKKQTEDDPVGTEDAQAEPEDSHEPENKSGYVTSDDEILHADAVQAESEATPVRTATITQNEDDQITDHIQSEEAEAVAAAGEDEASAQPDEPTEETAQPAGEDAPAAEEPAAESAADDPAETAADDPAEPAAEEPAEPAAEDPAEPAAEEPAEPAAEEPAEPAAEEPAEPAAKEPAEPAAEDPAETVAEEPSEPAAEEPSEPAAEPAEETSAAEETAQTEEPKEDVPVEVGVPDGDETVEEIQEDGVSGECYGGSQGKLYSPMGRENEEVTAPVDDGAAPDGAGSEPKAESEEVTDAGDVPTEQNGHEEQQPNGDESHEDVPNGEVVPSEETTENAAPTENGGFENDDVESKKAVIAAEESPATETTPQEAVTADE